MELEEKEEEIKELKVILLGETGVGKTCLINVSVGKNFEELKTSTVSSSFVLKKFMKDNKEYILNIWDTAGEEKFRTLTKLFIKNSKIIIFVYSIDNKLSFDELSFWVSTVKELLGNEPILGLVGNKSDLYMNEQVKQDEARKYAEKIGAKYSFVSAKKKTKRIH